MAIFGVMFSFSIFVFASAASASCTIRDVRNVGATTNVRTGPGTAYPVIDQVFTGYDNIRYSVGNTYANGYQWYQNFYYKAGAGTYSSTYVGWQVWTYSSYPDYVINGTGSNQVVWNDTSMTSFNRNAGSGAIASTNCPGQYVASSENVNALRADYYNDMPYATNVFINAYIWDARNY